jgi:hypothetical protein
MGEVLPQTVDAKWSAIRSILAKIAVPDGLAFGADTFNRTVVSWLTGPSFSLPGGSIVMLLCSTMMSMGVSDIVSQDLVTSFRTFLLTTSMSRNHWRGNAAVPLSHDDICRASLTSGFGVINGLDRILTPQHVARCDIGACQTLFLLLLGTAIGVSYSTRLTESPSFPPESSTGPLFQSSPTLWLAMREHLCQMLAHHLVYLGSILGIKLETAVERSIIEGVVQRWHKTEAYVWADAGAVACDYTTSAREEPAGEGAIDAPTPVYASASAPFVAIACPDIAELNKFDAVSENPASYMSMADDLPVIPVGDEYSNLAPSGIGSGHLDGKYRTKDGWHPNSKVANDVYREPSRAEAEKEISVDC